MPNAKRDANGMPMLLATLNSDGVSVQPIYVSVTNRMKMSNGSTGSGVDAENAPRDGNRATSLMGISADDEVTLVAIWADSSGNLLVDNS